MKTPKHAAGTTVGTQSVEHEAIPPCTGANVQHMERRLGQSSEVWFDLDGTLIDSAEGILWSLSCAFRESGISLPRDISRDIIGPSLREVVARLTPSSDLQNRERIATAFRESYDSCGYRKCRPFPGIDPLLRMLVKSGFCLRILTNKRQSALERIVGHLNWADLFVGVHGQAETGNAQEAHAKAVRALSIVSESGVMPFVVVGDGVDDLHVASATSAVFVLACWGYGCSEVLAANPGVRRCESSEKLATLLACLDDAVTCPP